MSSTLLPEISVLVFLRIPLFFGCRKYLLRSLYSDLQTLSSDPTIDITTPDTPPISPSEGSGIELHTLPAPATQPKSSKFIPTDTTFLHSAISRVVFSLVFAESSMMFFVLMLQGSDRFTPRARLLSWKFSLIFLMVVILVIVPLCVSLLLAVGSKPGGALNSRGRFLGPRILISLIPVALYLFALSKIPLPVALSSSDTFTATLSRLIVLGTIILGLLSGYGAVNSWAFIPMFSRSRGEPTDQDVSTAEYALQSVRNDLHDRRTATQNRANTSAQGSWLSRVVPNFRGDTSSQEIRGLQALEYQMSRNLEALRARRDAAKYARTLKGRIINVGRRIFAFYCLVRTLMSIINVLNPSRRSPSQTSYPDLIADLLANALSFVSPADIKLDGVESFARQLSLGLVGLIILTSVRRVLKGVTRTLRVTSRNLGASLMMLILSQLMGIYLLSTVVQLRNSFPPPPVKPDEDSLAINLFTTIPEFEIFGSLFDWSFLIAVGASAFLRWGADKINGVDDT